MSNLDEQANNMFAEVERLELLVKELSSENARLNELIETLAIEDDEGIDAMDNM